MISSSRLFKFFGYIAIFIFLGIGFGFNWCSRDSGIKSDVDKYLGGEKAKSWYNNNINEQPADIQDKLWAIADDMDVNLRTCDGIKKMQKILMNKDYIDYGEEHGGKDGKLGHGTLGAVGQYCSIALNTDVPFLGRCIRQSNTGSAFPTLMTGLMSILLTLFFVVAVIGFIGAGSMIAFSGGKQQMMNKGKEFIKMIVLSIVVLGLLGTILYMINPNFFTL